MQEDVERVVIGWCEYDKSEIFETDDYIEYKGKFFHRANFLQMSLDGNGNVIDPFEEEE